MKGSFVTTAIIFILSLAIWVFFYIWSQRLDKSETTVVVGFCIVVVLSGKWLLARISKKGEKDAHKN